MDPLSVASDVTCSVCLDMLTDPRVLTCMHSFCCKCLTRVQTKASRDALFGAVGGPKVIKCPDCRNETILDRNEVAGLPKNFTLASIAEKLKTNLASTDKKIALCSICDPDKKPATKNCRDCGGNNYCKECYHLCHPMKGVFKSHRVLDIVHKDDRQEQEEMMYCKTCENTALSSKVDEHQSHDVVTLNSAVGEEVETFHRLLEAAEYLISEQLIERERSQVEYEQQKKFYEMTIQHSDDSIKSLEKAYQSFNQGSAHILKEAKKFIKYANGVTSKWLSDAPREEKIKCLKMAKKRAFVFGSAEIFSSPPSREILDEISAIFNTEIACLLPDEQADNFDTGEAARFTKVKNLPSCSETAKVSVEWGPVSDSEKYTIKVSQENTEHHTFTRHEIQMDADQGIQSLEIDGLLHDCSYKIYLLKKHDNSTCIVSEKRFHTPKSVTWAPNQWSTEICHPDISVSSDRLTTCPERYENRFFGPRAPTTGSWRKVLGITSCKIFSSDLPTSRYWQTSVNITIIGRLSDGNIVLNLGMCKVDKEDNFSPLSGHRDCYCVMFYKLQGRPHIGLALWDGKKRSTVGVDFWFHVKSKEIQNLGFFLDCERRELKIILVNENRVIGKFTEIGDHYFGIVCEFLNENRVQACVVLEEPNVYKLPSVLFD